MKIKTYEDIRREMLDEWEADERVDAIRGSMYEVLAQVTIEHMAYKLADMWKIMGEAVEYNDAWAEAYEKAVNNEGQE